MGVSVTKLAIKMVADADGVQRGTRQAERALNNFEAANERAMTSLSSRTIRQGVKAAVGIGAVTALLAEQAENAIGNVAALGGGLLALPVNPLLGIALVARGLVGFLSDSAKETERLNHVLQQAQDISRDMFIQGMPAGPARTEAEYMQRITPLIRAQQELARNRYGAARPIARALFGLSAEQPNVSGPSARGIDIPAFDPTARLRGIRHEIEWQRRSIGLSGEQARIMRELGHVYNDEAANQEAWAAMQEAGTLAAGRLNSQLREQRDLFLYGADAVQRWQLVMAGASQQEIAATRGQQFANELEREQIMLEEEGMSRLERRARQLERQADQARQPTFGQWLNNLIGDPDSAARSVEEAERTASAYQDQADKLREIDRLRRGPGRSPAALEAGSQAAFTAINEAQRQAGFGGDLAQRQVANQERGLSWLEELVQWVGDIRRRAMEQPTLGKARRG